MFVMKISSRFFSSFNFYLFLFLFILEKAKKDCINKEKEGHETCLEYNKSFYKPTSSLTPNNTNIKSQI
jgi:hypothetical protein